MSWKGSDPMVLNVPLLFDNTDTGKSLEGDILNLEGIAGRGPQGGDGPVPFKVSTLEGFGSLVPHNFNGESLDWVISTLEWGEFQRRPRQTDGSGGHRVQQHATLQLTQYVTDKRLVQLSASKRANAHGRRRKTTKVKSGDTLQKISRREYGTSDRWQDIAILNKIRDPRHPGKVGKTLKLPR